MKIKSGDLISDALDWAVATCEGVKLENGLTDDERYSTEWGLAGPIIAREKLSVEWLESGQCFYSLAPGVAGRRKARLGPTHIIAAMRCHVANRLGDEIEVPDQYCK